MPGKKASGGQSSPPMKSSGCRRIEGCVPVMRQAASAKRRYARAVDARELREVDEVGEVHRHLEHRQRRHRDLEQLAARQPPLERPHRPERVLPGAEQRAALLLLLVGQLAGREEVGARERIQQVREHRRVIVVAAAAERLERALRQAESRPAEAARPGAGRRLDRVLGLAQLLVEFLRRIEVQPGLVPEAVVADLVARGRDRGERGAVLRAAPRPARR